MRTSYLPSTPSSVSLSDYYVSTADTWRSAAKNVFKTFARREVATSNIAENTKKLTCMTFRCLIALRNRTIAHSFLLSFVNANAWPSMSRTIVEIQKFCYHGNLTSRFSLFSEFLWVSSCERVFSQIVKKQWACEIILLCVLLPGKSFKFGCFVISNLATIFACTMQMTFFAQ